MGIGFSQGGANAMPREDMQVPKPQASVKEALPKVDFDGWKVTFNSLSTLETTQGQMEGFFSQLPFKCYLPEVASVRD